MDKVTIAAKPKSYKDLVVWQKAMDLAGILYRLTAKLPNYEQFGLISQMRRAAVSIPSNIAEGQARRTSGEFMQFISHAEGSAAELDTQLILSVKLNFITSTEATPCFNLVDEVRRMLNALRRSISSNVRHSPRTTPTRQ